MIIIAVDDEKLALKGIVSKIKKLCPGDEVVGFFDVRKAYEYAESNPVSVAFLDVEMADINGIEVAKHLKKLNPLVNIIFSTGYKEYMEEAFSLYSSGYMLKPITEDKIKEQLANLRFPVAPKSLPKIVVKTFGNFEVFIDDAPVKFNYSKTKELLAILIDKTGKMCSIGELASVLWEDEDDMSDHSSYLRNLQVDLISTFRKRAAEDVIIKQRGALAVDMSKLSCDFVDFLRGGADGSGSESGFFGEYMSQYSWAEKRIAMLQEAKKW